MLYPWVLHDSDSDTDANHSGCRSRHHALHHHGEKHPSCRRSETPADADLTDSLAHGHERDVHQTKGPEEQHETGYRSDLDLE